MVKNYYRVLGVDEDASTDELKRAFRRLAKELHPDKNPAGDARERFISVLEAYEVLSVAEHRARYDLSLSRSAYREVVYQRKEQEYREWFERYQNAARQRAAAYAEDPFEDFANSPVYRTAMAISKAYNYIFFGIGIFMTIGPFVLWYLREYGYPEARPWYAMFWPSLFGLAFSYGIYYFLFKYRFDDHE